MPINGPSISSHRLGLSSLILSNLSMHILVLNCSIAIICCLLWLFLDSWFSPHALNKVVLQYFTHFALLVLNEISHADDKVRVTVELV